MPTRHKFDVELYFLSLAAYSFSGFVRQSMPSYLMGWCHEDICVRLDNFLKAVLAKQSPRLILCMPPRHGKSELVSRRFPAYVFGRYPDTNVIAASYSADLASRMNRDVQRVMDDEQYFRVFPNSRLPKPGDRERTRTSDMFELVEHKGSYRSAGVGGGITGMGGDILILDDPFKDRAEADSPTIRQKVYDWYTSTFYTRLSPGGGVLVIATRWHPIKDDTPVLTTAGWKRHGDLQVGDCVFGLDGKPVEITHVSEPVWCDVEVKTKYESIVCAKTHLWPVRSRPEHNTVNTTAEKLISSKQRTLPRPAPLDFGLTEPLPIDPYWLGLWLGDGAGHAPAIICGKHHAEHCESTVYKFHKSPKDHGDFVYYYTRQGLRAKLVSLGLLGNKHIPDIYKKASIDDRWQLLAGLVDTDGDLTQKGTYRIAAANGRLYEDIQELVRSLGMSCGKDNVVNTKASVCEVNGQSYKRNADCRRFTFVLPKGFVLPCHLEYKRNKPRTITKDIKVSAEFAAAEKCGWGRCITTTAKDGIYLVGRSLLPTHNCDDLIGRLLEADKNGSGDHWEVVDYPAIATRDEEHRKTGEALHPERYPLKQLLQIKTAIGTRDWEALYQQHPTVEGGAIFRQEWLRFYTPDTAPKTYDTYVMSWDMTFKDGGDTDFAVGQVWGRSGGNYYLIDQSRGRRDFISTLDAFVALSQKHPRAIRKLVEDKANGPAVISALKAHISGIVPVEPDGSKTARAYAVTPLFEAGNVFIPDPAWQSWTREYVDELLQFPSGAHDDQVDATTQALRDMTSKRTLSINIPDVLLRSADTRRPHMFEGDVLHEQQKIINRRFRF